MIFERRGQRNLRARAMRRRHCEWQNRAWPIEWQAFLGHFCGV